MLTEAAQHGADLDRISALVPFAGGALIAPAGGACHHANRDEARALLRSGEAIVAHATFVLGRLGLSPGLLLLDALELFVFVRPAQPCVPSALGIARALGLATSATPQAAAVSLRQSASTLLDELRRLSEADRISLRPLVYVLSQAGWRWAPYVFGAIGGGVPPKHPMAGFDSWRALAPWEDEPDPGQPGSNPVGEEADRKSVV